ncbi:MAG: phenylalanyl-tRNA synthetase alpha chain [Parcubacteria group bacterium Greene0416_79]|nr:MAG: phenylalanyl-tRNA synthetase alpha chain [Parcubacteria group bacterium Greene0416_79]
MVEQRFCKAKVVGSNPSTGSTMFGVCAGYAKGSRFKSGRRLNEQSAPLSRGVFCYRMIRMKEGAQGGRIHPISRAIFDIRAIFAELSFEVAQGPEVEDEWHNFDALNIPKDHPARDMQDTFWLKEPKGESLILNPLSLTGSQGLKIKDKRLLLRTHTSPVQIRYIEEKLKAGLKPPYRIIVPGKVFRNEATDATHEAQFYQLEGLYVDKEVSMAHLKGVLEFFFKRFFGPDVAIRFRPSFFAFTEPSVEVIMSFKGKWLEMMGAGLVHPNVLRAAGVDPEEYSGFAFGGGIDRLLMVKYGIPDIRMFYNGDLRLVNQF